MDESTINIDDNDKVYINGGLVGQIDLETMQFITHGTFCSHYFTSEQLNFIAHAIEELKSDRYWNS